MKQYHATKLPVGPDNATAIGLNNAEDMLNGFASQGWRLVCVDGGVAYLERDLIYNPAAPSTKGEG